uniref:Avirulence protein AvrP4 n=1 Tax=Melampsora lini TaxID=5261 RepID=Q2MV48_MELLI|nr:AvrP4-WA [Melampsora lini]ACD49702.1 avirulence protein AvrP4 [Melampsora lini]
MLIMMGIPLRKIVLLSLIFSISIIPMMCEFLEDARDIQGFSRKSGSKLEEESDSSRDRQEKQAEAQKCTDISCTSNAQCARQRCGDCLLEGNCSG